MIFFPTCNKYFKYQFRKYPWAIQIIEHRHWGRSYLQDGFDTRENTDKGLVSMFSAPEGTKTALPVRQSPILAILLL